MSPESNAARDADRACAGVRTAAPPARLARSPNASLRPRVEPAEGRATRSADAPARSGLGNTESPWGWLRDVTTHFALLPCSSRPQGSGAARHIGRRRECDRGDLGSVREGADGRRGVAHARPRWRLPPEGRGGDRRPSRRRHDPGSGAAFEHRRGARARSRSPAARVALRGRRQSLLPRFLPPSCPRLIWRGTGRHPAACSPHRGVPSPSFPSTWSRGCAATPSASTGSRPGVPAGPSSPGEPAAGSRVPAGGGARGGSPSGTSRPRSGRPGFPSGGHGISLSKRRIAGLPKARRGPDSIGRAWLRSSPRPIAIRGRSERCGDSTAEDAARRTHISTRGFFKTHAHI